MLDECRNCGCCVHHTPTDNVNPPKLRTGEGKGQVAHWVCGLTGGGKHYTDGANCKKFEPRYECMEKELRWLDKVNKNREKNKPQHKQRTYIMSMRRRHE